MVIQQSANERASARETSSIGGRARILIAVLLVSGLLIAIALMGGLPGPLALITLGVFAAIGVGALLAVLFGLARFSTNRNEERLALAMLRRADRPVALTDANGDLMFANEAYVALQSDGALPLGPIALWSTNDVAREALRTVARAASDGRSASTELRVPGDPPRWYRVNADPLRDIEGRSTTAWSMIDISGHRGAEEGEYRAARGAIDYLDHMPVGFAATRPDGVIEHINATFAEWLDLDLTAFRQRELRIDDILNDDGTGGPSFGEERPDGVRVAYVDRRTPSEPRRLKLIERTTSRDMGRRLLNAVPVEDDGTGNPYVGEARGSFDRFYDATPVALAITDADGTIQRPNRSFSTMFGAGNARVGQSVLSIAPDASRDAVEAVLAELHEGANGPRTVEMVLPPNEKGAERYVQLTFTGLREPQADNDERIVLVHATESTEQKAIEAAYIQGQKMQAVGLLAGGLAHDFNNVLSAITMSADLLLETHGVGDPSHADIRNVKTSASKAAALVRQLLAFSRKQTLRPTVLNLADTLSDGRMLYQRLANPAKLELELGSDLWSVKADVGQFEQVVTNLVANARDAMPDGGTIVIGARNLPHAEAERMTLRGLPAADYVMVEVVDQGIGMTPEVQAQVFDPFYTTKDVGKGTGLGMATVYGIIKQSGGYIYVDSEVNVGTRFRIMLPRHIVTERTDAPAEATTAKTARDLTGSGTVLVVEDDNAVRPGAVRALTSRGYTVHEAADGEEALEILEELNGEVDIIVSDVVMPGMDGPTFLREMRAIYGDDIPFVFASGHAEDAFAKNLPEGSVFSFLPKPYSLSDLATKVKDVLNGKA